MSFCCVERYNFHISNIVFFYVAIYLIINTDSSKEAENFARNKKSKMTSFFYFAFSLLDLKI